MTDRLRLNLGSRPSDGGRGRRHTGLRQEEEFGPLDAVLLCDVAVKNFCVLTLLVKVYELNKHEKPHFDSVTSR